MKFFGGTKNQRNILGKLKHGNEADRGRVWVSRLRPRFHAPAPIPKLYPGKKLNTQPRPQWDGSPDPAPTPTRENFIFYKIF